MIIDVIEGKGNSEAVNWQLVLCVCVCVLAHWDDMCLHCMRVIH